MTRIRRAPEIKVDVLTALAAAGDPLFASWGFKRAAKGHCYKRKAGLAEQLITLWVDYNPKIDQHAEVQFRPYMTLHLDVVSKIASKLVQGDHSLLACSSQIIVNQPVEFAASKEAFVRWFAQDYDEMVIRVKEIADFAGRWIVPYFDVLVSPEDLIKVYTSNDNRMMKQHHWYIYIAAAYIAIGQPLEAMKVLESKLGSKGLRKDFAVVFESVEKAAQGSSI